MARLLDMGDLPFLGVKIAIGVFASLILLKWGDLPLAKYGVAVALTVYVGVMGIHVVTGLSALGYHSFIHDTIQWFALFA